MDIASSVALVVVLGIAAQWLAGRLRVPAIVPLMIFGILAGPVLGLLHPHEQFGTALDSLVGLAVALILFEGGLRLRLHELGHASSGVKRLVYAGIPLAFLLGTLTARYVGGFDWPIATTFGAISVVTGPTVVLPLLRHAMLRRRIASTLKWEAILNDPAGALLAVLTVQFWLYHAAGKVILVDNAWQRLSEPRLAGVPVFYGEILSNRTEAALELTDVGTLLAASANDAYNALVCASFAAELGHENVFQLPMHASEAEDPRGIMRTRRGRVAFSEAARYELLYRHAIAGWRLQKTTFSETFDYAAFRGQVDAEAITMALRRADGSLPLLAAGTSPEPKTGDVLFSFVPSKAGTAGV